jgi:nucleoside-diphosphate-sugar epimerase
MTTPGCALVLGASGVTGTPFTEQLLAAGWKVFALSRRAPRLRPDIQAARLSHLPVDLEDAKAVGSALRACPDITHVFHCANAGSGNTRQGILDGVLDAIEEYAPGFCNFNLLQGMKYYGCHLGPFRTPAGEDDPRTAENVFYYAEEDLVRTRQSKRSWTWTALRPHSVCGYAAGNPLNLALVLAIYASLRRERREPLWFPASAACFASLFQVMDADILARAAIFVSTDPACGNKVFNVSNGDVFRWQDQWPAIATFFELEPAGPDDESLADFIDGNTATWAVLADRHRLRPFPITRAASWVRGDYSAPNSRFACEYDLIADTARLRSAGFSEMTGNTTMFLQLFQRYRAERIIP